MLAFFLAGRVASSLVMPWLTECFQLPEASIIRSLTYHQTTMRGEEIHKPLDLDKVRSWDASAVP